MDEQNQEFTAAVFHHLVSCVHKIVANGQQTDTHRAIDKNRSTISHKKPFNYFQIETSTMKFLCLFFDVNVNVVPVRAAIS